MREAAAELAEGSPVLEHLHRRRAEINRGIEGRRIDLAVEGSLRAS